MKTVIEKTFKSAEMCVICVFGAWEIAKVYPGVIMVTFAVICAVARIAYIEGMVRGMGV